MTLFQKFKEIIFSDETSQRQLIEALNEKGYVAESFEEAYAHLFDVVKEKDDLQLILAPFLRALAIKHLREGKTDIIETIRSQYSAFLGDIEEPGDAPDLDTYLNEQSEDGVYAQERDILALAEILGVTVLTTRVDMQSRPIYPPQPIYSAPEEDAAIIHLYHLLDEHFFVEKGNYWSTLPDGNCLYNGFAQIMRQLVLVEQNKLDKCEKPYVDQVQQPEEIKNKQLESVDNLFTKDLRPAACLLDPPILLNTQRHRTAIHRTGSPRQVAGRQNLNYQHTLIENESKLFQQIFLIAEIGIRLEAQGFKYINEHKKLVQDLSEKITSFFSDDEVTQTKEFHAFQTDCIKLLDNAQQWANEYYDYKQALRDFLQTLTVIGALLGGVKWLAIGRYSLFPIPTEASKIIEETRQLIQPQLGS